MEEKSENSNRRTNKPLMEKRRRARINTCLSELKTLVLMALNKDNSQFSKLEKADILEMAVKYLRHVQNASMATHAMDSVATTKYRLGYGECAREVLNCLGQSETVAEDLRRRVSDHLSNCLYGVQSVGRSSMVNQINQNYRGETPYLKSSDMEGGRFSRHHYIPSPNRPVVDITPPFRQREFLGLRSNCCSNKPGQKADIVNVYQPAIKCKTRLENEKGSATWHRTPKCKPTCTVSSPESPPVTNINNSSVIDKSSERNPHLYRSEMSKKRKLATDFNQSEANTKTNSGHGSSKRRRLPEDSEASGDKSEDESVWRPW